MCQVLSYPCFTGKESKAHRQEVTFPESHSWRIMQELRKGSRMPDFELGCVAGPPVQSEVQLNEV